MLDLLHCLLPELDIRDITYDDKEQPGLFLSEKKSIFDLSCTTGSGERIVVEMQIPDGAGGLYGDVYQEFVSYDGD